MIARTVAHMARQKSVKAREAACAEAFLLGPTVEFNSRGFILDYNTSRLSTFRVFCTIGGTVLENYVLWADQVVILIVFLAVAGMCMLLPHAFFSELVQNSEAKTRSFLTALQRSRPFFSRSTCRS